MSSDNRNIVITSKDRKFLYQVREVLHLQVKLGRKSRSTEKEKKYSVLQFGDVCFYQFLQNIGLTKRKSLTLSCLKIPDQYFHDFLRGVIDGDGSIQKWRHATNGNMQWSLRIVSGSPFFLPWIKGKIKKIMDIDGKIYIVRRSERKNPLYILKYGKFAAKVILRICYYNGGLALQRKLKKTMECLQSENGLSKYGIFIGT